MKRLLKVVVTCGVVNLRENGQVTLCVRAEPILGNLRQINWR